MNKSKFAFLFIIFLLIIIFIYFIFSNNKTTIVPSEQIYNFEYEILKNHNESNIVSISDDAFFFNDFNENEIDDFDKNSSRNAYFSSYQNSSVIVIPFFTSSVISQDTKLIDLNVQNGVAFIDVIEPVPGVDLALDQQFIIVHLDVSIDDVELTALPRD